MKKENKTYLLLGLFVSALAGANFLGAKITSFDLPGWLAIIFNTIFYPFFLFINSVASFFTDLGIIYGQTFINYHFFNTINVSVGILAVPLMFLITDIVEDVLGKEKTRTFVHVGIITMVFLLFLTILCVWLPADPTRAYFSQENYATIFGVSIRMIIASILAFALAQYHDIWAFNFWKNKTKGRFLWLRNNASTIVSQLIDSTVFMFIAFYALTPKFNISYLIGLIIPYWIFKILFSLLDTPFVYWGVKWLKKENK